MIFFLDMRSIFGLLYKRLPLQKDGQKAYPIYGIVMNGLDETLANVVKCI
jgi:hypothetical protein